MSSATQGPWSAFDDEIVADRTDQHICTVPLEDGINPTEWQANLRLIAAAPTMYHELEFAADTFRDFSNVLRAIGKDVMSAAADVAERHIREYLATIAEGTP